eukprot:TRINITY_DN16799_c0_g1_i1.p3 TRINITY_DN16799_c0_g1~~TRINITY_DN16799_c0_g1_i1.p3  ORF type:complete len:176 (+),score=17.38 TRINITY_DN16799_c0_g1_i1:482-1009(+)
MASFKLVRKFAEVVTPRIRPTEQRIGSVIRGEDVGMTREHPAIDEEKIFAQFRFDPVTGFRIPWRDLPPQFAPWQEICENLPDLNFGEPLYDYKPVKFAIDSLKMLDVSSLKTFEELASALTCLTYMVSSYTHASVDKKPPKSIPANIAVPFAQVCRRLGEETCVYIYPQYSLQT